MLRRVPIERQDRSLPSQSFQLRLRFSVAAQHYRDGWKGEKGRAMHFFPRIHPRRDASSPV